ncbi:hypothetical protein ACFWPV_36820 [Streptomyces uncialis]|uniref:hypothetical protein n=1 Tax=Streptomyces uncialis TaxID=1048205 RepID=UPI0036471513
MSISSASAYPNWQPWVSPGAPNLRCGPTTTHTSSANIAMQTCIIRNPANDSYQAVAIVVNNHTDPVFLKADVILLEHSDLGTVNTCDKKTISAGSRVACYGATMPYNRTVTAYSWVYLNAGLEDNTATATYS